MKKSLVIVLALALAAMGLSPAVAQQAAPAGGTLEKIGQSGTLTIGTRTGSPPFAYVNAKNEWVGLLHRSRGGAGAARHREEARQADQGGEEGVHPAHPHPAADLERGGPDRGDHDRHADAAGERGLLASPSSSPAPSSSSRRGARSRASRTSTAGASPPSRARPMRGSSARRPPRRSCASSRTSRRPSRRCSRARSTPTPTTASSSPASRRRRRTPPSGRSWATSSPTSPTAWRCGRTTPTSARW